MVMLTTSIVASLLILGVTLFAYISRLRLESLLYYVAGYFFSSDISSRVALRSPVDEHTLLTVSGDLVTYLEVRGARRMIGPEEFDTISAHVAHTLQLMLQDGSKHQHAVGVGFLSDPPGTPFIIDDLMRGFRASAQRMGCAEHGAAWFNDRQTLLTDLCNEERVVIALYTLRSGLAPQESQRAAQWAQDQRADVSRKAREIKGAATLAQGSNADYSQNMTPVYPVLTQRHDAMVESFLSSLKSDNIGIMANTLTGVDAIYCLRRFVDGAGVPISWRPDLFGDRAPTGVALPRADDLANAMPAPIARQIFSEPMYERFEGFETVLQNGIWYGSVKMDVCPHTEPMVSFSQFKKRIGTGFPYAIHFEISPNGLETRKMDQAFAGFFGGFGTHNRSVHDAWNQLKEMDSQGLYVGALRLVVTTWAADEQTLGSQLSTMKMALQNWGGSTVSNESGAPANLLISTAPGLARFSPAPYLPAPIETIARMLPLYQAHSPWSSGQLVLRTPDGRPYPIDFGSSIQAFWGTLVFAPPGRGKSFLMNCINAGVAFTPGISELPYMTIIDKGMSSANVIAFVRAMLPPERRHQAVSVRLRNTVDYAINIFDTQLGMDRPTERERDFQINMLLTLCPNLGPEGGRFIGQVIDAAFTMLGRDSQQARSWQRALDYDLSARIEADGMVLDENNMPRVWEVVDRLFDLGDPHATSLAQRFAVPILDDLINAAHADSVQDLYRKTPTESGEMITDVFVRAITTAAREYALISTYTRFDVGDARILAIDLEEVLASASSEEARRKAAVMILFARQMGAKNYFLKFDEIEPMIPDRYQKYHARRIKIIFETLKFLEYDEFHNAHGMVDVLRMVEQDFREGRKYNVVPLLSSQLLGDFSPDLIEVTTCFFMLGVGSAESSRKIQEMFEVTETERKTILNDCLGPGPHGAPLFGMFKTDRGDVTQLLYNSASPSERWAFNSSALDVAVRSAVLEAMNGDYWKTMELLVTMFPSGSARDHIKRVRASMGADASADDDGVTATVARQAVRAWLERQTNKENTAAAKGTP